MAETEADKTTDTQTSTPETAPAPATQTPAVPAAKAPRKTITLAGKRVGLWAVMAGAAIVLVGGSAAAYFGVVVPNKPENVLKTSVEKLLQQHQVSTKGSLIIDMNGKDTSLKNITINFTSGMDTDKHTFDANLDAAASGIKIPVELRSIDQNLYFKLGDLSSIKGAAALASPAVDSLVDSIGSKLSNQWVEVDQSLLKQANAACTTNVFNGLNQQDIDQLGKLYAENEFISVKNTSADTFDGQPVTRYDLALNKQKADNFAKKVDSLSAVKQINDCTKKAAGPTGGDNEVNKAQDAADKADISFVAWVGKSKTMKQLQVKVIDKDNVATFTVAFTDAKVDIKKPDGAKPLLQVLGDFSSLFNGLGAQSPSANNVDGVSQACLAAIQAYGASGGTTALPPECM